MATNRADELEHASLNEYALPSPFSGILVGTVAKFERVHDLLEEFAVF